MANYILLVKKARWYLKETIKDFCSFNSKVFLVGYAGSRNFGDGLNLPFVTKISKKHAIVHKFSLLQKIRCKPFANYSIIGSVMGHCDSNTIVWGTGCISKDSLPKNVPRKICAVRGPLTRQVLLDNNIKCPEVYGDPALLLPCFYKPNIKVKYKLGIIPHYLDANHKAHSHLEQQGAKIIDVNVRHNWKKFVDEVLSCECIVSSSLHGLIVADAYSKKTLWCEFSDKILGNRFKYYDYYLSIGINHIEPHIFKGNEGINDLIDICDKKKSSLDLSALIDACPFDSISDVIKSS